MQHHDALARSSQKCKCQSDRMRHSDHSIKGAYSKEGGSNRKRHEFAAHRPRTNRDGNHKQRAQHPERKNIVRSRRVFDEMVGHTVACQTVDSCIQVEAEEAYERIEGRRTGQFLKGEPPRQRKSIHRPSPMRFRFEARAPFVSTTAAAFAKRFLSIGRHSVKIEQRLWIILPALTNPSRRKRQRDATPDRLRRVFSTDAYQVGAQPAYKAKSPSRILLYIAAARYRYS